MKPWIALMLLSACIVLPCGAGTTITYTYDAQHRLVQASYSASEKVFYNHDAAGNVDMHITITAGQYLKSFLYWLSAIWPDRLEPGWLRGVKA